MGEKISLFSYTRKSFIHRRKIQQRRRPETTVQCRINRQGGIYFFVVYSCIL